MSTQSILDPNFVYEDFYNGYLDGGKRKRIFKVTWNKGGQNLSSKLAMYFYRVFHLFLYKSGIIDGNHFTFKNYTKNIKLPICTTECLSEYIRFCIYYCMKMYRRKELRTLGILFISKNTNNRKGAYEINLRKPSKHFVRIFGYHKPNENLKRSGVPKFCKISLNYTIKQIYKANLPNILKGNEEEILIKCFVRRWRRKKIRTSSDIMIFAFKEYDNRVEND
uniref:Uncharacterized protein n=1 Tax=Parastrongyloides trichosuri TaxID=131310 RepID=A0A0N4ZZ79_PARTI